MVAAASSYRFVVPLVLVSLFLLDKSGVVMSNPSPAVPVPTAAAAVRRGRPLPGATADIRIVFSDLDGTLIHYDDDDRHNNHDTKKDDTTTGGDGDDEHDDNIIYLPASATGRVGTLTGETLALCRTIRRHRDRHRHRNDGRDHCKLALISGMRYSTLMSRLPYLPRADAYACDSGGRIFLAHDDDDNDDNIDIDGIDDENNNVDTDDDNVQEDEDNVKRRKRRRRSRRSRIVPVDPLDAPFYLTEDLSWRQRIEAVVGPDGYVGHELLSSWEDDDAAVTSSPTIPLSERTGPLWTCAARLQQQPHRLVIDTTGYATCFRINRNQQQNDDNNNVAAFDALLSNHLSGWLGAMLTTSVNLGCIDVVPVVSGKKNCCQYLAELWITNDDDADDDNNGDNNDDDDDASRPSTSTSSSLLLRDYCLCLCDDDNDIAMALACRHAFLPTVSSETMRHVVSQHADQCTVADGADDALRLALAYMSDENAYATAKKAAAATAMAKEDKSE